MSLPPLALYIHVPWCVRKCPYCDFNSHAAAPEALPERAYIDALIADLDADLPLAGERPLTSIFIGGGTPSLFSGEAYARLLAAIRARLPLSAETEVTLEANPGTVERAHFDGYRAAGINRLSLGVQSFDDAVLERLGRIHGGDDAEQAIALARRAGFDNLNVDLMHGLPGQDAAGALNDIERALALAPEHLSWYQLTLEPNTAFYSRPPVLPEEEVLADIQEAGHARLEAAGLGRYEISAYCRPGRASQHNLNYWHFGDYLGIGAGAHGKLSAPDGAGGLTIERRWKTRQPEDYLRRRNDPRGFVGGHRSIPEDERPLEFLMNALRLVQGVPRHEWRARTGLDEATLDAHTERAQQLGLLERGPTQLKATPQGLLFLNDLLAMCDDAEAV
ncbi:anaerobic coproporphyrinogen III oxidase [Kushneria sinocarnis]|uniref:Heme chaperone HemW n=1 Tax=Kushneria sinocarnis TaxID=595502 RepID=A0A420X087_9GAMM|nr:radical SAM family heme chaperone HemW [Kushneria sinocarnis]RKR07268.1 anaerobic coproporphyrinogen III oxidase [Kushneria sinocarnis]